MKSTAVYLRRSVQNNNVHQWINGTIDLSTENIVSNITIDLKNNSLRTLDTTTITSIVGNSSSNLVWHMSGNVLVCTSMMNCFCNCTGCPAVSYTDGDQNVLYCADDARTTTASTTAPQTVSIGPTLAPGPAAVIQPVTFTSTSVTTDLTVTSASASSGSVYSVATSPTTTFSQGSIADSTASTSSRTSTSVIEPSTTAASILSTITETRGYSQPTSDPDDTTTSSTGVPPSTMLSSTFPDNSETEPQSSYTSPLPTSTTPNPSSSGVSDTSPGYTHSVTMIYDTSTSGPEPWSDTTHGTDSLAEDLSLSTSKELFVDGADIQPTTPEFSDAIQVVQVLSPPALHSCAHTIVFSIIFCCCDIHLLSMLMTIDIPNTLRTTSQVFSLCTMQPAPAESKSKPPDALVAIIVSIAVLGVCIAVVVAHARTRHSRKQGPLTV